MQTLSLTGKTFRLGHTYADNGSYTVTVAVADDDGGTHSDTRGRRRQRGAAAAAFNAPNSVAEGSPISISLTGPSDPSSVDTAAGFTYAFDTVAG